MLQEPSPLDRDETDGRVDVVFNIMVTKRYSTTFIQELITYLVDEGIGVFGTDLFVGPLADIPEGDGPFLIVRSTGGVVPERTQNLTLTPAYQRPSAQVLSRGAKYVATEAKAFTAYAALVKIRNVELNP